VGGVNLPSLLQAPQDNCSTRKGDDKTDEYRRAVVYPGQPAHRKSHAGGKADLENPAYDNQPPEALQFAESQLHTDTEQEQGDPDFSEDFHLMYVVYQPQSLRTDQYTGEDKSGDCRQGQPVKGNYDDYCETKNYE
jgi:hypothetical protein